MPRDKSTSNEPDLLEKMYGNAAQLEGEELDSLYEALAPSKDPASIVRRIAEAAAVQYRKQNRVPPDHVQAALDATRTVASLEGATSSKLQEIVLALKHPFKGAVTDLAYAYRNRDGALDSGDQAIMDDLNEELERDWDQEDE